MGGLGDRVVGMDGVAAWTIIDFAGRRTRRFRRLAGQHAPAERASGAHEAVESTTLRAMFCKRGAMKADWPRSAKAIDADGLAQLALTKAHR